MLYAKINPAATYTVQVSPFSATTTQCSCNPQNNKGKYYSQKYQI